MGSTLIVTYIVGGYYIGLGYWLTRFTGSGKGRTSFVYSVSLLVLLYWL